MTAELWASIITTVVVPIVLRTLVHFFPWLADAALPERQPRRRPPDQVPEEGS